MFRFSLNPVSPCRLGECSHWGIAYVQPTDRGPASAEPCSYRARRVSFHFARIISYIKGKSHLLQDLDGWTSWLCVKNIFCKIATEKLGKEKGVDQFASK